MNVIGEIDRERPGIARSKPEPARGYFDSDVDDARRFFKGLSVGVALCLPFWAAAIVYLV